ncbi:s-acyltransferase [Anaeramoeba flamelloides]|uniref:S-acyltransferase n=1 Tax=Anaeramoeba flamelloides TaxID=1746091 RepID=A0AAV7YN90_9EUKA|nr:s-acyltransferase [Anaeramoeba flamelloides]
MLNENFKVESTILYPDLTDKSQITKEKYYEHNPGNNHVFCSGKSQIGSDPSKLILTTLLINVPCTLIVTIFDKIGNNPENTSYDNFKDGLSQTWYLFLILVYAFVNGVSILDLFIFHLKLISKNLTTREKVKNIYKNGNPFDLGFKKNWAQFFKKIPPTPFKYNQLLTENELQNLENPSIIDLNNYESATAENSLDSEIEQKHGFYNSEDNDSTLKMLDNYDSLSELTIEDEI